jgi:soluble lytic murein transglycosylase-like protein
LVDGMRADGWIRIALVGLLSAPLAAAAGDLFSFVDADGVVHFTNAPSDARYKRVRRTSDEAGVYRDAPKARARPSAPSAGRTPDEYREHIRAAAKKYELPEALILAVMAVESAFDPRAVSEAGAIGLMQLMPDTARDMFVSDPFDPAQNIEGGARYLRFLANQYGGDAVKTLAAYNAGPEAVRRSRGDVPDIPETRAYVRRVVDLWNAYKAER